MSEEKSEYVDLSQLDEMPEDFQGAEEAGFVPKGNLLEVGWYHSPSRKISYKKKEGGNLSFQVEFGPDPGLRAPDGRMIKYPPRAYLSTKMYLPRDQEFKTSQVAEYLRECGIDPQKIQPQEFPLVMRDTQTIPLDVKIGAEDDQRDRPLIWKDGKQVPGPARAYTKDFLSPEGKLRPAIIKDGVTLKARNRVERFKKAR